MIQKIKIALVALTITIPATIQVATTAQANTAPTVAILDTALDTSLPIFQGKIIQEVCILEWNSCPNGTNFMEGPGASVLPSNIISSNGFDHGTQMASAAVSIDPNVKIVFIRIIGNTPSGARQTANEVTVTNALKWVLANKDKYNIKSVAMSQGHHDLAPLADYCPTTPNTKGLVSSLMSAGVATFFPAGNSRDYSRLDWPACINESISVGWSDQYEGIALNGNFDKDRLDFYALGSMRVTVPGGTVKNGAGSSISVQVAAATWALLKNKYPSYTQDQMINFIKQNSSDIRGSRGQFGKLINTARLLSATPAPTVVTPTIDPKVEILQKIKDLEAQLGPIAVALDNDPKYKAALLLVKDPTLDEITRKGLTSYMSKNSISIKYDLIINEINNLKSKLV